MSWCSNKTRQSMPGERLGFRRTRLARHGCALRWTIAMHRRPAFLVLIVLVLAGGCSERPYRQTGSSMAPTINSNEVVAIDYAAYATAKPQRWDVVLIRQPNHRMAMGGYPSIRRVVGLPGESLKIEQDAIYIGEDRVTAPSTLAAVHYLPDTGDRSMRSVSYPYEIPTDAYFVLGDNPIKALDSRHYGAVPLTNILGKVPDK